MHAQRLFSLLRNFGSCHSCLSTRNIQFASHLTTKSWLLRTTPQMHPIFSRSYATDPQTTFVASIPEPPTAPIADIVTNVLGEPSLSSLGLCSYWPSGWYQGALEAIHVYLDVPWWGAIAATTLLIRLSLFPLIIKQRRSLSEYTKTMPKITGLQQRLTEARLAGDHLEMMRISKEMQELMANKDVNPLKTMRLLFFQIPIFLSVFAGLRGMANLPVPSMKTGGLWWFTDLTIPDPYYLLPLLSMSTILIIFETGTEISTQHVTPAMKMIMRVFPCIGFLMVMNMPSALLMYWSVSNLISLTQALLLRVPPVRDYLKLPAAVKTPAAQTNERSFVDGFKESMLNSKLLAELEARERVDAKVWQKAGQTAIPRTFVKNPTISPSRVVDASSAAFEDRIKKRMP